MFSSAGTDLFPDLNENESIVMILSYINSKYNTCIKKTLGISNQWREEI
jgi:hypothetical protein